MRSAVTISLVPEARDGPFIFWEDLNAACEKAAVLGFDGMEIFPPGPDALDAKVVGPLLSKHGLKLAAAGTGAGWVLHKLHLCSPDMAVRQKAVDFIRSMIDRAGALGAPTIIGSMQGRWGEGMPLHDALGRLADALGTLGAHASQYGVPLLYEPLNRYETNLVNTIDAGVALLRGMGSPDVRLLADLYHMNIEEVNLPAALRQGAGFIGHLHLADSNRRPAGEGHTDFAPIAAALKEVDYQGYVSAEALPYPSSDAGARRTIEAFRRYFAQL